MTSRMKHTKNNKHEKQNDNILKTRNMTSRMKHKNNKHDKQNETY